MKTLREIFDKHKCDKGSLRHCYDRVYEPILQHLRDKKFNLLEIGILRGESMESWLEFFPYANVTGIDIFQRVPANKVPVLKNPRVSWCVCDSLEGPNSTFQDLAVDGFDVIIDDGLHFHDAQRLTFENFIPYLKNNGVYFIEDVWPFDHMNEKQKKHKWLTTHGGEYSDKQYKHLLQSINNYYVKFHDIRKGYQPETYVIEIRK